ncbi:serine protease, partial [Streptomyces sp. URMC 124]
MRRPLLGTLTTTLLLAGATVAGTGAATAAPSDSAADAKARPKAVDFAGTVALSNCSGSLIRLPSSSDNDPG